MPIKRFNPVTPTRRYQTVLRSSEITAERPYKPLLVYLKENAGRNNYGRITVRHRGGGHKRLYRIIDFRRNKWNIPATVESIEYDPNRSANIALICYADGERSYILAPQGLQVGQKVIAGEKVEMEPGNAAPIGSLPIGANVHNVELVLGRGGQLARSAGTFATITGRDGDYTIIKLPSGESRKVHNRCMATVGVVGNNEHELVSIGKAGRSRWLGRRPSVRGVAMNPIDHPLGGGEGKTSGGRHPVTPWGKPTRGKKTRNPRKTSERFILSRRVKTKGVE
ncbi:MAG: 50S ribosomal protein L2 [Turneriella sp.]|nr:50S ribosomal protein L2 [Leptospiraceae bacterium]MCX7633501.1 50S ribosomal protein L2 [Turneriella sp.]